MNADSKYSTVLTNISQGWLSKGCNLNVVFLGMCILDVIRILSE